MHTRAAAIRPLAAVALLASPCAAQTAPVEVVPLARFGCADCAGPLLFTTVAALAWLDDQRVLVVAGEAPFVRIFTADGRPLAAFGTAGSGPGELRTPVAAAAVAGDTLEVLDLRLLRLTRFDAAGATLATRMLPRSAFPLVAHRLPDDAAWLMLTTDFRTPTPSVRRLHDDADAAIPVLGPNADFPRDRDGEPTWLPSFAITADGSFAIGEGAFGYRIRRYGPDGSPRGEIVRDLPRPHRTPAEMRREEDRRARMADRVRALRAAEGGGPGPLPPVRAEHNHFDAGALAFDAAGRLWVRTTRGGDGRTIFDLFDSAGAFLGEVSVDARVGAFALRASRLVGVVTDPDEVVRVATWRVAG